MNSNAMEIDAQLCQLLDSLSLQGQRRKAAFASEEQATPAPPTPPLAPPADDAAMSDSSSDSEDSTYRATPSRSAASGSSSGSCGCAYLQAVWAQIRAGAYATTSGDFLETIFTHREALYAFPQGHRACAAGFTELARDLETRALRAAMTDADGGNGGYQWRPDWDGDHEAVVAFRHEAWVIANAL